MVCVIIIVIIIVIIFITIIIIIRIIMLLFAIRCLSDVIVLSCSLPHVFFPPWRGATYSMHGFYDHFNNLLFRNSQNTYIYIYIYIYTRDVHIVHNTHNTCINIIHTHPLCMLLRICTNHIYIYIYNVESVNSATVGQAASAQHV